MSGPTDVLNGGPDVIEVPADTWAPVPMRYELVRVGDVILGRAGPLMVTGAGQDGPSWRIDVTDGQGQRTVLGTADATAPVLIPLVEREAVLALRTAGMGPRLIDRAA